MQRAPLRLSLTLSVVLTLSIIALLATASPSPAHAETPLKVFAAGSLAAPLKELIAASGLPKEAVGEPVFGPAGLLEQRLEKGETADLYLSADMAHPERLAGLDKARFVIAFARNDLCLIARQSLGLTPQNTLTKLLDPKVRLGTSTPGADPGGDYAESVFKKAGAAQPDADKILEAKALRLMGSPNAMAPIAGKSPVESIFLTDSADAMLYYCSGQEQTVRDVQGLVLEHLPPNISVQATYGMTLLSERPEAQRLALFILSQAGQAILAKHGLLPVLDPH